MRAPRARGMLCLMSPACGVALSCSPSRASETCLGGPRVESVLRPADALHPPGLRHQAAGAGRLGASRPPADARRKFMVTNAAVAHLVMVFIWVAVRGCGECLALKWGPAAVAPNWAQ